MGFEEFPRTGAESRLEPTPEDIRGFQSGDFEDDFRIHLTRKLSHKHADIVGLRRDPALRLNYRWVKPEFIQGYFSDRPSLCTERHQMVAWRVLISRILFIKATLDPEAHIRDQITESDVRDALKKIYDHMESPLGSLNMLHGNVLYIAGSDTFEDVRKDLEEKLNSTSDPIQRQKLLLYIQDSKKMEHRYGPYRYGLRPVQEEWDALSCKDGYTFDLKRLKIFDNERERKIHREKILAQIRILEPPATFVLDLHGNEHGLFFHQETPADLFIADFVGAFVDRAKKFGDRMMSSIRDGTFSFVDKIIFMHCKGTDFAVKFYKEFQRKTQGKAPLPIALIRTEYGQNAVGSGDDFFYKILALRRGGANLRDLVVADRERLGYNNFVLFVPDMFSAPGRQSYIPITRRDQKTKIREDKKERGWI